MAGNYNNPDLRSEKRQRGDGQWAADGQQLHDLPSGTVSHSLRFSGMAADESSTTITLHLMDLMTKKIDP